MENRPVYCGNNRLSRDVQSGRHVIGTRHRCLKKGFGTGYHIVPPNRSFTLPYEPLTVDQFYCGNRNVLPDGYERFGTLPQCFNRGVGVGMRKRADEMFGLARGGSDTGLRSRKKKSRKKTKKKSRKKRSKVKRASTRKTKQKSTRKSAGGTTRRNKRSPSKARRQKKSKK